MRPDACVLDNLLEAIRSAAGSQSIAWARPPQPLEGGFWAQMWRIRLDAGVANQRGQTPARAQLRDDLAGELVARVMPDPVVAARETALQDHLGRQGYPTPMVRLSAAPGPELDRAWMLMDHAPGRPLLTTLSGIAAVAQLPRLARALPDQLARHAAALHAIDPATVGDRLPGDDPLGRIRDQAGAVDRGDLVAVADHLSAQRPAPGRAVVCHGDLHPFNILSHPSGDTVLDWSAAQLAEPEYDLALTRLLLAYPPLPAPRPLRPVIDAAGRALARRFVTTYARRSPNPIDEDQLDWYADLHALRIVTEVATWRAENALDDHPGHPFRSLAPALTRGFGDRTGVDVSDP